MKFLLFFYFVAKFGAPQVDGKDVVDENFGFYVVFSFVFFPTLVILFCTFTDAGLMDFLSENWFYDYGEMHSRHYLTPIGFLTAIVMLPLYLFTKKYLYNVKTQTEISELFDNKKGRALAKSLGLFPLLIFLSNAVVSVAIGVGYFKLMFVLVILYLVIELMVRNTFVKDRNNG